MTDYASQLLDGAAPKSAPKRDYASELLSPKPSGSFSEKLKQEVGKQEGTASFGGLVKAGMVDDPQTKLEILANDLFPGDKKAVERFAFHNGEVYYVGADEKLYRATPPEGPMGSVKEFGANMVANAPTIVGGTVGAIAGAPSGPGSVGLSALGAAGGKSLQQIIANVALDEPQSPMGNIKGMAGEAAWAAGGSLVGLGVQKWLARNLSKDVSKLNLNDVAELDKKAARLGVDLNAAQRTNLPSLKGRVEALSRLPQSADDMNTALEATRQQAAKAADDFVSGVSNNAPNIRAAGEAGRKGATAILERMSEDKAIAAAPWYRKAFQATVNLNDEGLQRLTDTPAFKAAWERGKRIAANEGVNLGDAANNMKALHYVKLGLDDLIERGGTEGIGGTERRAIIGVKNRLLNFMDTASPDYGRARFVYGHYMPTLKANREGLVGQLADLADTDLNQASRMVFNSRNSPQDIANLRSMFFRYDQGEQWKALLKGYLEDTLEVAGRELKSGNVAGKAATWRYALMGDRKQAQNLRAAMTYEQWQSFGDMMDVFEAVNRTTGRGNSITMQMLEASGQLKSEAGSKLAKVLKPRQAVIDWLEEARLGKHAAKQVEILNDPQSIKRLKELKRLSPTDQKFIQGFSALFGISASPE